MSPVVYVGFLVLLRVHFSLSLTDVSIRLYIEVLHDSSHRYPFSEAGNARVSKRLQCRSGDEAQALAVASAWQWLQPEEAGSRSRGTLGAIFPQVGRPSVDLICSVRRIMAILRSNIRGSHVGVGFAESSGGDAMWPGGWERGS
ncbi:hypothetical protein MPTK1_1g00760 [Marchantia polymorpha subsp. ruderalis]|uniref:Secreted protein n=2 Tax=Marchantia polymorpha TaxID=3197 RepID=A0AAF6AK19_MARPO|nr:hypothetical protein MARPO_0103s0013 [Marchantia polymorpha]BBM96789.1 hypothetical protein Mp_1g00760 [Marchantia polymorpha subsp. ruderalis]|eukprot:PTQ32039.1 hypothetical protein MARPO_0103s0013 [Marchantia polymorpha]